jgi:vancomycin permeability regulator SanA
MKKFRKTLSIILRVLIIIIILLGIMTLAINLYMINYAKEYILTEDELSSSNVDCVTVLGASVKSNGTPSNMLEDRLNEGVILYNIGVSNRIIMSGDHKSDSYDEVNTMKNYAIEHKIPSSNIFMDHAGLNTYDSMYRLKNIFEVNTTIIVTQDYHLYRAIYIARELGIEAYGVTSNPREYKGQIYRDMREVLARVKDYFKVILKPKSIVTGDTISVFGDGDSTNDK